MTERSPAEVSRSPGKLLAGVLAAQVVALVLAGWLFRHALNPDGVAYLRIASYYAEGNTHLAISGYWSPLFSWALVPFLKAGVLPLVAARILMGLSAIVFLLGCHRVFRQFEIPPKTLSLGLWLSALISIPWSVENITPDLLVAGLVCLAFANTAAPRWFLKPWRAVLTGAVWGLAFLCKAVALPLGILTVIVVAALWWRKESAARPKIAAATGLVFLGLILVSGPWIGVMSSRFGKFTVATSAAYNHSLVGPSVARRVYLLDQGFHKPPPGRVTIWENPSPPYPNWSAFANWSNTRHQLRIIFRNLAAVFLMLSGVSLAVPFLLLFVAWRWLRSPFTIPVNPGGGWALVPVAALAILYLPNYLLIFEQRYFYATFPLLFAATIGMLGDDSIRRRAWIRRYGFGLVAICFLLPTVVRCAVHLDPSRMAGDYAWRLAQKISRAGLAGPIAGSGRLPGGRAGLYTAYFLDQPWYGNEPGADPSAFHHSGAGLIVVRRGTKPAHELVTSRGFQNLDVHLFGSTTAARQFPLQVFRVLPMSAPH